MIGSESRILLRLPPGLCERVDEVRGQFQSRNSWLVWAVEQALGLASEAESCSHSVPSSAPAEQPKNVEQALNEAKRSTCDEQADSDPVSPSGDVKSAAPAEHLDDPLRWASWHVQQFRKATQR